MKAAQFFANHDIRVVDVPQPTPKEHEVLVAVEWCGICGSDLHEYLHGPVSIPVQDRPHPVTGEYLPVTMGHEFAGCIASAPSGSNLKPGQPVMIDPRIYCRTCPRCTTGNTHGCSTLGFKGVSGTGGGFSEMVAIDERLCHPLPDSVDLTMAALIEPLAVAWHAAAVCETSDWSKASTLILGGGPIGTACVVVLRARGCTQIYVSEPTVKRAAQNRKIADAVFNPITENVGERCRELTGGRGVDIVFDCAGVQNGFDTGIDALRFKGTYTNVAAWTNPMTIPFGHYMLKEIVIKGCLAYDDKDFKETVEAFVAGTFQGIESMVTSRIHIDDIAAQGFDELEHHRDDHIKILVTPKKLSA